MREGRCGWRCGEGLGSSLRLKVEASIRGRVSLLRATCVGVAHQGELRASDVQVYEVRRAL